MKRVAVLIWQPAADATAIAAVDAAAMAARQEGKALHFYVLTPDQGDCSRYRHASVEYVAARGWRRGWAVARLLQQLLVRYDLACLAGLSPALTFFCRGYRMRTLTGVAGGWRAAPSASVVQLLLSRQFAAASGISALPELLRQADTMYDTESRG